MTAIKRYKCARKDEIFYFRRIYFSENVKLCSCVCWMKSKNIREPNRTNFRLFNYNKVVKKINGWKRL